MLTLVKYEYNKGIRNGWHCGGEVFKNEKKCFEISDMPTGCGIMIIHKYFRHDTNFLEITPEEFKSFVETLNVRTIVTFCGHGDNPDGSILTRLLDHLKLLGFKIVDTYPNHYHENRTIQSCLIYTI